MCRRITCPECNKPSYTGCGAHIEQVLGDIPKKDRCQCSKLDDNIDNDDVMSYKVTLP
jgi:hypothetical protein